MEWSLVLSILFSAASSLPHRNQGSDNYYTQDDSCPVNPSIVEGYQYTSFNGSEGSLGLVGNVNDVLYGRVTNETVSRIWNLNNTGPLGFGAGAIGPLEGAGEAIYVNGIAFVRQTDNGSSNYYETISGSDFRTPFAFFALNNATADGEATFYNPNGNINLTDFYARLYESVEFVPVCFFALVEYEELEGVALSKAPIYGEFIDGDIYDDYYTQPGFHLKNQFAFTGGCVANYSYVEDAEMLRKLRKLLYLNPADPGGETSLQTHSHSLSLTRCVDTVEDINVLDVDGAYHMLSNSTIKFLQAKVFKVNSNERFLEL